MCINHQLNLDFDLLYLKNGPIVNNQSSQNFKNDFEIYNFNKFLKPSFDNPNIISTKNIENFSFKQKFLLFSLLM